MGDKAASLCFALLWSGLILGGTTLSAQSRQIASVDVDSQGKIHIVTTEGEKVSLPLEADQVSCTSPQLAEDKRTAGWLVNYDNCCTSYPIPLGLVIYRDGKAVRSFHPGQSIWGWQFEHGGDRVAFWTGPTHGDIVPHCELHDIKTGKLLAQWDGHFGEKHPDWVTGLKE